MVSSSRIPERKKKRNMGGYTNGNLVEKIVHYCVQNDLLKGFLDAEIKPPVAETWWKRSKMAKEKKERKLNRMMYSGLDLATAT